jgi:hypothetical protein
MNRSPILRTLDGKPLFSIVSHEPDKRGGVRTCTVVHRGTGRVHHGPDTDIKRCVWACDKLSGGEDIFPYGVVQASVDLMQMRLEV